MTTKAVLQKQVTELRANLQDLRIGINADNFRLIEKTVEDVLVPGVNRLLTLSRHREDTVDEQSEEKLREAYQKYLNANESIGKARQTLRSMGIESTEDFNELADRFGR